MTRRLRSIPWSKSFILKQQKRKKLEQKEQNVNSEIKNKSESESKEILKWRRISL